MKSNTEIVIPRRIFHGINFISIAVLTVTGMYIHRPFSFAPHFMGLARWIHFEFLWIFTVNFGLRLYWSFFGKNGDWRTFVTPKVNRDNISAAFRHYFLYQPCPVGRQCNLVQNLSYTVIVLLLGIQIYTGFMLYYPTSPYLQSSIYTFGGLAFVRELHFFFMWIFITFTIVHLYMVFAEEPVKAKIMFFGGGGGKTDSDAPGVKEIPVKKPAAKKSSAKNSVAKKPAATTKKAVTNKPALGTSDEK